MCKEFGLEFNSFLSTMPGPLGGRIWLEDVQCNGTEQSIFNCTNSGWGNITDCSHENDVGITCTSMQVYFLITFSLILLLCYNYLCICSFVR